MSTIPAGVLNGAVLGEPPPGHVDLSPELRERNRKIVAMYGGGDSVSVLASSWRVLPPVIRSVLSHAGVALRAGDEAPAPARVDWTTRLPELCPADGAAFLLADAGLTSGTQALLVRKIQDGRFPGYRIERRGRGLAVVRGKRPTLVETSEAIAAVYRTEVVAPAAPTPLEAVVAESRKVLEVVTRAVPDSSVVAMVTPAMRSVLERLNATGWWGLSLEDTASQVLADALRELQEAGH